MSFYFDMHISPHQVYSSSVNFFIHMRVFLIFIFLYRFPEHARSNCGPETGKKVNLINSNSEALVTVIAWFFECILKLQETN